LCIAKRKTVAAWSIMRVAYTKTIFCLGSNRPSRGRDEAQPQGAAEYVQCCWYTIKTFIVWNKRKLLSFKNTQLWYHSEPDIVCPDIARTKQSLHFLDWVRNENPTGNPGSIFPENFFHGFLFCFNHAAAKAKVLRCGGTNQPRSILVTFRHPWNKPLSIRRDPTWEFTTHNLPSIISSITFAVFHR